LPARHVKKTGTIASPWRYDDVTSQAFQRRNLRSPSHERSIRLMEEQFIHFQVRAKVEFHSEALKLVDDEGSALVGTEFVGWLAPNCHRELSITVLPDNNSHDSLAERALATQAGSIVYCRPVREGCP
jgi:hypothetical protein